MPLFEYQCSECSAEFEKIVPTHTTRVVCQSCGSRRVEKKLSVFAVAGGSQDESFAEGGCGTCGAERPGMCQM